MRIRKIENRGARGSKRFGLKIGKQTLRELSESEINIIFSKIRKNIFGNKRHYKNIKRTIRLIRKTDDKGNRLPAYDYKECPLLDVIYPDRNKKWLERNKRKKEERIELKKFSFIDYPVETYQSLQKIVKAEARNKSAHIDFLDKMCVDISPYLVLGLMHKNLSRGVFLGGDVSGQISDVMHAVKLLGLYGIRMQKANCYYIYPFEIITRRKTGSSEGDNLPGSTTTEDKASGHFAETFNNWLKELTIPLQLEDEAYIYIGTLFSELLENAKRHSDLDKSDGQWHIAGFMEARRGDNYSSSNDDTEYVCHFSIISLGSSIFESMQSAPQNIKEKITRYVDKWSTDDKRDRLEAYWNLCAIQDGFSRISPSSHGPKHGFGIMESLVSLINAFGATDNIEQKPVMTIISGKSCIMVKDPYNDYIEEEGERILAFNEHNDLDKPPDNNYVSCLPYKFLGTLITVRFLMDSRHLIKIAQATS